MKKFISIVLVLSLLLCVFVGCKAKEATADPAPSTGDTAKPADSTTDKPAAEPAAEEVTLKFYAFGFQGLVNLPGYEAQTQNLGDAYQLIIDDFTKDHPNVKIELTTLNPAGGGTEQLDVDLASGTTPNVYYDSLLRISKYNGLEYLSDMSSYVSPEVVGGFTPGSIEEGALWYMPTGSSPMVMCVNKTLFEEIGATDLLPKPEDRNWTVDQFVKALEAVKAANRPDTYGTILWAQNQSGDACNMSYLWGFGARFFDGNDYSKSILNNAEGKKAMAFLNDLSVRGLSVPGAAGLNDDDMWAMWQNGQIAVTGGYPYLEDLAKEAKTPFEPYFVNYPHADGQPNPPLAPDTHAVAVFTSENEAENAAAAQFAEFLATSKWAAVISQALGDMTVHTLLDGQVKMTEQANAAQKLMDDCGIISYGPACAKWSELRPAYAAELQAMYSGAKTSDEAADAFVAAANTILAD